MIISENECEMEEDISEIASVDEVEVENEILVENEHSYDSEDCHSGSASATASPSASATPGISFTATPGPTQEMSNKNPLDFFRWRPGSYTKQRPLARCYCPIELYCLDSVLLVDIEVS